MEHTYNLRRVLLLLAALILLAALPVMGQLTPIPDIAFRVFLQTNHPEVMVGDDLNTNAPELALITSLHLTGVSDFTGIEHFQAIDSLWLYMMSDTGLEPVPWPQVLPPDVEYLHVGLSLSDVLIGPYLMDAPALTSLYLDMCRFSENALPGIPPQVERLTLFHCGFAAVPVFSESLHYLEIDGLDGITTPAAWPDGLDTLQLYDSQGVFMQDWVEIGWPEEMRTLQLSSANSGYVLDLPSWPAALEDLSIMYFGLQDIPPLPASLHRLVYQESGQGLLSHCLPSLPLGLEELIMYTSITCLPNKPPAIAADPAWDWAPVCTIWNSLCLGGNEIQGAVFSDVDSDGTHDAGEDALPNANVVVQPGNVITSASGLGEYSAWVSAGDFTIEALPYLYQTPTGVPQTASFSDVGGQDVGNDVGLYLTPNIQDLVAGMYNTPARPGFENTVWLGYSNVGTIDVNATVRLTFDPTQEFVSADPAPGSVNGNILEWPVSALMGQGVTSIEIVLYTDPAVPIGTSLTLSCVVDPTPTDETPSDNTIEMVTEVTGSYDPNDKQVQPTTLSTMELADGRKLEYTIRFQNTGTFHAEDVLITDVLSGQLDPLTFEFAGSSHPCQWYISDGQLQVFFDQIMLPDSGANEIGSHGFLSFRIAPVTGLMNGATIENSASIFFDFNAPIVTEPAVFSVSDPTAIPGRGLDVLGIYPNPVVTTLWLRSNDMEAMRVVILDVSGRIVMDQRLGTGQQALDVSALPAGLYQVRVSGARVSSARFVKR